MNNKVILKGKKVILRPLSLKDAPRFCAWLKDTEVTKFLGIHHLKSPSLAEEREWIKEAKRSKDNINLSIDTVEGEHIGSIGLKNVTKFHSHAELGIMIGNKKYWGQGCGTEATDLLINYAFRKLKLHRVYLYLVAFNTRAERSYKRVGFKREGVMREHWKVDSHFHDKIVMGVLREEYLRKLKSNK